ncbi:MAG: ribonuclease Z [Gemmatimonadota bacterium]
MLGSGTLVPDDARRSAAHLVEAEGVRLLMDCGSGAVHGMARARHDAERRTDAPDAPGFEPVEWRGLTHLVLSHFHTDHTGDIPALLFALKHGMGKRRTDPLTVLGPPGVGDFWRALEAAFGGHVSNPGFALEVVELERADDWTSPGGNVRLRTHPTPHTRNSLAWRVETDEGVAGYTGDTGPDARLGDFFRGVDVLIAECSLPDPPRMDTHLTPAGLAALAKRARPGTLIATHAFPGLDPGEIPALVAEAGYEGKVLTGRDGMMLTIQRTKG